MNMTEIEYKSLKNKNTSIRNIPESSIQSHIKHYLMAKGWMVWKNHQSLGSYKGLADLTAIRNGIIIFIEVKTEKGKLSEHQKQFRDDIIRNGGNFFVARSLDDIIKITQKYI